MEEENQVDETTNSSEELDLEVQDDVEDVETIKAELEKERQARVELTARAKRAEAEAKALKAKAEAPQKINNTLPVEEVMDVKILQSQGVDEEQIAFLKDLAKVKGTSLLAAQHDNLYKLYKAEDEAKRKSQEASLPASRGSGQVKRSENFNTPSLSDEKHKELWKQKVGN